MPKIKRCKNAIGQTAVILCVLLGRPAAGQFEGMSDERNAAMGRWLARGPWTAHTLNLSMRLLNDRSASSDLRALAIARLRFEFGRLPSAVQSEVLREMFRIAFDTYEPVTLRATALEHWAALVSGRQPAATTDSAAVPEEYLAPILLTASSDGAPIRLRQAALRAVRQLNAAEALPTLRSILGSPYYYDLPGVARPACLALLRIRRSDVPDYVIPLLKGTNDPSVFGTAVYCLKQVPNSQTLAALVQVRHRFPQTGVVSLALADLENVILEVLSDPDSPVLREAVIATAYLYRPGQHERFLPSLRALLATAPVQLRPLVVERLLDDARRHSRVVECEELRAIRNLIAKQEGFRTYVSRIDLILDAKVISATPSSLPVNSTLLRGKSRVAQP